MRSVVDRNVFMRRIPVVNTHTHIYIYIFMCVCIYTHTRKQCPVSLAGCSRRIQIYATHRTQNKFVMHVGP